MILILTFSFLASTLVTLLVVASAHRHARWSADHDVSGPQKMHARVVPRVGGVGIAAGLLAGGAALCFAMPSLARDVGCILLCTVPAFVSGLVEDFTKRVTPRLRMAAIAGSGALAIWLLGVLVTRTGAGWFDALLAYRSFAIVATLFAVVGVTNSINIIDGMNGLASMCIALMMAAICYIAFCVKDPLVGGFALATLGSALGFFTWNYPRGLIFLGDGGAYLLGIVVSILGLLLICRHPEVSPLTPLLLVIYPVFETVFTMYRRRVLRARPVSMPDGIHLHTLIYRRLMRWAVGSNVPEALTQSNSLTSPFLWVLSSCAIVPAAIWWGRNGVVAAWILVFVLIYLRVYWRIVRFRTPGWMSLVARRGERRG